MKRWLQLIGFCGLIGLMWGCKGVPETDPDSLYLPLNTGWEFAQTDSAIWRPATVPGNVHADLLAQNIIPDPYYRLNEQAVQWVGDAEWQFRTSISVTAAQLEQDELRLVFPGLDTYAQVKLNGQTLLDADNMFRTWQADVKEVLKPGENELLVTFYPPVAYTEAIRKSVGYDLPADNDASPQKASIFTRKAPYHFGWDWGPRLVTAGIWKTPYLEGWKGGRILDYQFTTESINGEFAETMLKVELEGINTGNYTLTTYFERNKIVQRVSMKAGNLVVQIPIKIPEPRLWWPRGSGDQELYDLRLSLAQGSHVLDTLSDQVGVRTVELVQETDEIGESFYFKVNGEPVYMRGANAIPGDPLLTGKGAPRYRQVLLDAAASNMNMVRVWGGGIYETDEFYALCDSLGLMVWQDFMFACSMYPGDQAFRENVRLEAEENVRRLRNHPSLALWCGNNEMEVAWNNWGWQQTYNLSPEDSTEIWNNYLHLFDTLLPAAVAGSNPSIDYLPTSPVSNWGTPENFNVGDNHYWGVWHGEEPFAEFRNNVPRFMSEYGFQSFPELRTVAEFSDSTDWEVNSTVMKTRQKSYKGSRLLTEHMDRHVDSPADFAAFLYLNQWIQAEGMALAIKTHRKRKPHCMGTLYWQLNDAWGGPTWSGIDHAGRWKAMQYRVRDLYKPVAILPDVDDEGRVSVHVVADVRGEKEVRWEIIILDYEGKQTLKEEGAATVSNEKAILVWEKRQAEIVDPKEVGNHVLRSRVWMGEELIGEELLYFAPPKDQSLAKVALKPTIVSTSEGCTLSFESDQLIRGVFLSFPEEEGRFSENYFDILPGIEKQVEFEGIWSGEIEIRHLGQ